MFDFPDTMPSTETKFATYIPARQPAFKVHNTEGLANSALGQRNYHESYAKYEFKGGQWVKVFEYQPPDPDDKCHMCNEPYGVDQWQRTALEESLSNAPRWSKKPICIRCYNVQREQARREQQEKRDLAELERLRRLYT